MASLCSSSAWVHAVLIKRPPQRDRQVERNVLGLNRQMQYARPNSLNEAIRLVTESKENAFVMAGGTDLLVRMKGGFIEPDLIVDIKRSTGLRDIKKTASGFGSVLRFRASRWARTPP